MKLFNLETSPVKSVIVYAFGNALAGGVPFFLLPFLTRLLAPGEYAKTVEFSLLMGFCLIFAGVNISGMLSVAWFKLPKRAMKEFTGSALITAFASTVLVAICVYFTVILFPNLLPNLTPITCVGAALAAGFTSILSCKLAILQSKEKPFDFALFQISASAINCALSVLAVAIFTLGGAGRNYAIIFTSAIFLIITLISFVRNDEVSFRPQFDHFNSQLTFGIPLVVHSASSFLLITADRWMVSFLLGEGALAIYGVAIQFGYITNLFSDAFVKAYGPWLYKKLSVSVIEGKAIAVKAVYLGSVFFVFLSLAIALVVYPFAAIIVGVEYYDAIDLIPWIVFGGAFGGIYRCVSVLFFYFHRTGVLAWCTIFSSILGIAISYMLVLSFGVYGAALGFIITQAIFALITIIVASKTFELNWWLSQ